MCAEYLMLEGNRLSQRAWLVQLTRMMIQLLPLLQPHSRLMFFHAGLKFARHLCCIFFCLLSDILITSSAHSGLDGCRNNLMNPGQRRVGLVEADDFRHL